MAISVFFDRLHGGNQQNSFLESLDLDSQPRACPGAVSEENDKKTDDAETIEGWCLPDLDIQSFMTSLYMDQPKINNFIHYEGSLTFPPCSEGIEWNLLAKTLPISDSQLDDIINRTKANHKGTQGNNRRVQALNDRTVYWGNSATWLTASALALVTLLSF